MMSGIRGKDTKPEMIVRRGLHAMGFRYRLHDKSLPGKPDLVLPKYNAVIFVHGCFWHKHDCNYFKWPKTRPEFWREKLMSNFERDKEVMSDLELSGWRIAVVWECAVRSGEVMALVHQLSLWLQSTSPLLEVGVE